MWKTSHEREIMGPRIGMTLLSVTSGRAKSWNKEFLEAKSRESGDPSDYDDSFAAEGFEDSYYE